MNHPCRTRVVPLCTQKNRGAEWRPGNAFMELRSVAGAEDSLGQTVETFVVAVDLHAGCPCAPDNGTQVADSLAVADLVDVLLAAVCERSGNEADAVDDVVKLDLEGLAAVAGLDGSNAVADFGDGVTEVGGNLVVLHCVTQEGGVGKAGSLCCDQVVCVLDDDGVLAGENEVVSCFAGGLAAAEEQDLVANGLLVLEELGEVHALLKAGDVGHGSDNRAGSDDVCIKAGESAQIGDFGVEADLDALTLDFSLVPLEELLVVLFEGHCRCSEEQTAQLVGLLKDNGVVALLFKYDCCFHTADTAADDSDLLGGLGRSNVEAGVLHGGGVQCAAAKVQGVDQSLHVLGALCLGEVEAAVVAADAGLDLVFAAFEDLVDPLVVNEVLTGDSNCVESAGSDLFCSLERLHTACADNGSVGEVLDVLNILQVAVVGHVLRRMCPVPCVVSTVVAVEHCIACVLEVLDGLLGLFHVTAPLLEVGLIRHCALAPTLGLGDDGVTERYGEVIACILVDALNDLNGEAEAVLEGSAVLVGTVVPVRHGELVKQVAFVDCVDLNAVNAGVAETLCGLTESFDHFLDLGYGEGTSHNILSPAVRSGGAGCSGILNVDDGGSQLVEKVVLCKSGHPAVDSHGAAEACCQLNEDLGTGLVELFDPGFQLLEHGVILIQPLSAGDTHGVANALHTGEDKSDAVLCAVHQEVCSLNVEMVRLQPTEEGGTTHGALDYAVFDLHITDLPGGKKGTILFVHAVLPFKHDSCKR